MKRLLAAALAAASISAFAAWERIGALKVADVTTLGEAAGKVGQMIGNPLVSAGVASGIADMATIKFFGPGRAKTATVFTLLVDSEEFVKDDVEDATDDIEYAVLYPMTLSKADFIKRHKGAFETNGVVVVKGDFDGDDLDESKTYVVFSADGKWAGASDKLEQCAFALKDVPFAEKTMEGDVVRLHVDPVAFRLLSASAEKDEDVTPEIREYIKSLKSAVVGLGVTDLGVDINACVVLNDGTELSKIGRKPLGADPLAFAGVDAFSATACAEGSGKGDLTDDQWSSVVALCKTNGLDVAKFVSRVKKGETSAYTLDVARLMKLFDEDAEKLAEFDGEKFMEEIQKIGEGEKLRIDGPASSIMLGIKGFKSQWSAAERFAATLPEASAKNPFYVSFISVSSIIKAIVPHILAQVPEEQREAMKPVVAAFAVEQKRGLASAAWREGESVKMLLRLSADEIRGLGGIFTGVLSMGLMDAFGGGCDDADDDDKDETPASDDD